MAISLTTITGAAVTGFTTPTYTVTADTPPNAWSKQWAVTAIGGTQAGVDSGATASRPWTMTFSRPQNVRQLNAVDGNNVLRSVPMNDYVVLGRKGLTPLAGQAAKTGIIRTTISVPAGADTADVANVKALISSTLGALAQQSSGLADTVLTGVL